MNLRLARYIDRWVGLVLCFLLHGCARVTGRSLPPLGTTTPPPADPPAPPRRVLAIKFYGLGNIVMIMPVLRALRAANPGVAIDFLTLPGNGPLLERSGLIERVLSVDVGSMTRFARSVLALFRALRRGGYDTVLDFEQFLKVSGIFAFATGAPRLIGLNTEGQHRGWLYTTRVAYTDSDHTTDIFLRLIAPLGVRPAAAPPWRLPVAAEERTQVRGLLPPARAGAPLVVMHVGTGPNYGQVAVKRWEIDRFAALADALVEHHGATVVFTGQGVEEHALIRQAQAGTRHPTVDTCDRLGVGELAALLAEATFVVSNDTAIMHLAGAVGTPVAALFGPTSPLLYGPRGPRDLVFYKQLYCSPCVSNYNLKFSRCTNPVCMRSITLEEVLAGVEAQYLGATSGAAAGGERS